jgi:hypothetical protein
MQLSAIAVISGGSPCCCVLPDFSFSMSSPLSLSFFLFFSFILTKLFFSRMVFFHCRMRPISRCQCAADFEFPMHPTNLLLNRLRTLFVLFIFYSMFPFSSKHRNQFRVACCVTDFVFLISFFHPPFLYIFILFYLRPAHFLFCDVSLSS